MKARHRIITAVLVVAVLGLATQVYRYNRRIAALEARLATAEQPRIQPAAHEVAPPSAADVAHTVAAAAPAPHVPSKWERMRNGEGAPQRVGQPEARQVAIVRRQVHQIFGPTLAGLGLAPDVEQKIEALLAERVFGRQDAANASAALSPAEQQQAIGSVLAGLDQQMKALVPASAYATIEAMVAAKDELTLVQFTYEPTFAHFGVPLRGDQALAVAQQFKAVYSDAEARLNYDVAGYREFRTAGIDMDTGLSAADRDLLARVTGVLSPTQVAALKAQLAATTAGYVRRMAAAQSVAAQ